MDIAWSSVRWSPNSDLTFQALEKATEGNSVDWSIDDELEWPWNTDVRGESVAIAGRPRLDLY